MLNSIITFSVKHKLLIGLFTLGLIGYGLYQFDKLPIDAVPDITDNQVQVITISPSLGAPDVERLITFPIEQVNSNIPGLKAIRSFSRFGLSLITLVFEDDVDIYWARQQVTERIKQAEQQIPAGFGSPELAPVTTGLGEIYQYILKAKPGYEAKYDATELRTIQDWIVKRQLVGVKGVADVSSFGGKLKQYEIGINPAVLKSYNLTINDVFTALEKNNENTGGAYLEKQSTVLYIRAEGLIKSIDDIKRIVVKNLDNGNPVLISDIAEVNIGHATRYGAITYNDEGEVAGAVVMMLKGGNSSEVIDDVKAKIDQIKKTLPEGVELEAFLDRTKMVDSAIGTVSTNLMEGALIVIFVLVIFLGNLRAGLIVASVIPLSLLFAVIMMNMFGVSGNLMSLGALDFGLIVDGAVIIVEAVMHSLHHKKSTENAGFIGKEEMDKSVIHSAGRMMNSAVFGQIIILIVYLPIFTLEGIEGKMFKPMAQTVAFALIGAFVLSLTYIPMMSSLVLSKKLNQEKNLSDKIMDRLIAFHQKFLKNALHHPKIIIGISILLLSSSLFVFSRMGGEFIPELPEGDFAVETRVLTGSNLTTSTEAVLKSAHVLLEQFPEIEKIVGKTGSGEIPTDPMPMEASDMMIILKDKSEWTSASSWDELSQKMGDALKVIPGVTFSFQYPVAMRFNELMTGAKQDVVCKIFGESLDTLSKYSKILGDVASSVEGAQNIYVEPVDGLPQLIINYNRGAIAQYGLNIQDINNVVNTAFAGQSSGLIFEDERRFDLVVRLTGTQRQDVDQVKNLLIPTPAGSQIPLYLVADVSISESINQIQRDDAKRRIIVGFNVHGRDVQTIVKDLQSKINTEIKFPSGYYVTYGGAFENLEAAKKRLMIAVPLSLLLIFIFLFFAFGSVRQGLLIYSAIPLSAIGGIFSLALRDMPFSISAGIGFIALFGVSVLNGIVLLAEFNRIKADGETDAKQIVLLGTKHRLRPVLMTAFVASLGFLPMALSHGNGAEVQRPLATVVIGGLLLATFLTLFVLPILYTIFEKGAQKKANNAASTLAIVFVFLFIFDSQNSVAQTKIELQPAIDTATKNNLKVRNERLYADYQHKLKKSAVDIPQLDFSADFGQINSAYNDNKFGISQSFSFPTVYAQQKRLQIETHKSSLINVVLKEAELKKQVTEVFYSILFLEEKKKILLNNDSIFGEFLQKANARFEAGESNILEKTSAEMQRGQIDLQLNRLTTDLEILQLQFNLLLNSDIFFEPTATGLKLSFNAIWDSSAVKSHPQFLLLEQEKQISLMNKKLQKTRLYPDLNVGYSSGTIQGIGADEVFYDRSQRFNTIQVGIGIPLFYGAQKAKIASSEVQYQIAENNMAIGMQSMNYEIRTALNDFRTQLNSLQYYESVGLNQAETIITTANLQFKSGEINYLEWTLLMNSAVSLRNSYLDAVQQLNQTIITLNFLTSK